MTNVKEIIAQYLKANGFDGLYSELCECGCDVNDLMPCDGPCDLCAPAIKHYCPCCGEDVFISLEAILEQCKKTSKKMGITLPDLFAILADGNREKACQNTDEEIAADAAAPIFKEPDGSICTPIFELGA